ncbi:YbaB/EbfC family nucleoid-associated protein [Phycicoccus sp. MAQZ13P-2]|uniref:YbaB/EbfC family nucleoid-associated protein n=1 Tax=Phycicoccus mangrovi TaxID=2840470 RepID=UPI001C004C49|nr:YbaB/EbfC family nucleoid-associated protein [Phycicoccus mangrovi]MBT9254248.1 YbaB/EbfC family nucleoid-associated protein [Phycicoccus mangrovi]MBT9272626.1 YbaB/EbfC family nucleoid-associated protein [Phycicoccus mangrovi]
MTEPRGYSGPEEALAAIAHDTAQAGPSADKALAWQREAESLTGTGTSEGGHVRAEVDVQGMLTGLVVADVVAARGGRVVTRAVRAALRAAQESVREKAARSAEDAWGAGSATAAAFRAEVEQATPLVRVDPPETDGRSIPGRGPRTPAPGGTW